MTKPAPSPRPHRWAAVAIAHIDEAEAERLAELDEPERVDRMHEVFGESSDKTVREPVCADCRVSWADVHRETQPWPCAGPRPDALGGTLLDPTRSRVAQTRQQRRAKRRGAAKEAERPRRDAVRAAVAGAVFTSREKAKANSR